MVGIFVCCCILEGHAEPEPVEENDGAWSGDGEWYLKLCCHRWLHVTCSQLGHVCGKRQCECGAIGAGMSCGNMCEV